MQAEVFFIHHQGEQRGPYTVRQIAHHHRCRYIDDETLYWREGMEQWQPVSEIIFIRRKKSPLLIWATVAAIATIATCLFWLFGSITTETWREMTSSEYSAEAAWWRARGLLRDHGKDVEIVNFDPFPSASISLNPPDGAQVELSGTVRQADGTTAPAAWRVRLRYNESRQLWTLAPRAGTRTAMGK